MKRIAFCLIFVLMSFSSALANVNESHPRIWLNSNILTRLADSMAVGSPEWNTLKDWCDAFVGKKVSSGYRGEDWYKFLLNYSLAYQVSGNEVYAKEGVIYLQALLNDRYSIGDSLGAPPLIGGDSNGWTARTFGAGVAIARDWLDGSDSLTNNIIDLCGLRLAQWINWYNTNPAAYAGPASVDGELAADNFYAGYFSMVYTAAIGLAGDPNYQTSWLTQAAAMWNNNIEPLLSHELAGGDWAEGWSYGSWAAREYVQYLHALETGTNASNPWNGFTWHNELVQSHLHMLYPQRDFFSDDGSMSGSTYGPVNTALMQFLYVATPITSVNQGLAKWYVENVSNNSQQWENFLWTNNDVATVTPTNFNMNLSINLGGHHVLARSDYWLNQTATIIDVVAKADTNSTFAEGDRNAGELKIGSRGEELLVDGDSTETDGQYQSVPYVTGSFTYAPFQEWWQFSSLISAELGSAFYVRVKDLKSAYDGKDDRYLYPNLKPSLTYYEREILFIRPDIVIVYDNANVVSSSNEFKTRFYFAGEPTVSGAVVTGARVNNAKLFATTVGVEGSWTSPILKNVSTRTPGKPYYVDFDILGSPLVNQIVTVFETADWTKVEPTGMSSIKGINVKGVHFGKNSALFKSNADENMLSNASYKVDSSFHYVSGFPAWAEVEVKRNGTIIAENVQTGAGGIVLFNSAEGLADYSILVTKNTGIIPVNVEKTGETLN